MCIKTVIALLIMLLLSTPVLAKRFSSQYCEFELPAGWSCALEGAEWVCQASSKDRQKEAIIILAAKHRGTQDSLESYEDYLKKVKTFTIPGGKTQISEPKYTKSMKVNDQTWIDSLHMASEVPGFFTRYLATVKEDLGVAVTFSVAKDHYDSYKGVFDNIINSMRVFRNKGATSGVSVLKTNEHADGDLPIFIPEDGTAGQRQGKGKSAGAGAGATANLILIVLAAAGVGGFLYLKKKGKNKKKK